MKVSGRIGLAAFAASLGVFVSGASVAGDRELDAALRTLIAENHLTGDPIDSRKWPIGRVSDPLPRLGMLLFYTKGMSPANDVACVSCHHPFFGFGDNLPLPVGVGAADPDVLGPGRHRVEKPGLFPPFGKGDSAMPRNSPTLVGLAFWDQSITWDGTVFSETGTPGMSGIDGRIIAPVDTPPVRGMFTNFQLPRSDLIDYGQKYDAGMSISAGHGLFPTAVNAAMRGSAFEAKGSPTTPGKTDLEVRQALAARIGGYGQAGAPLPRNEWVPLFRAAFHDHDSAPEKLVTTNTISNAIAAFERTMTFTHTPWRAYVRGDAHAIGEKAKRGAYLFFTSAEHGGAGCASCHKGDFFTDEKYYDLAVPQIGRGKTDLDNLSDGIDDWGRGHITGAREDKYDYRTPTLLGVEMTAPYGHSGAFATLEQMVRHHLNVEASLAHFDYKSISASGGPINTSFSAENTNYELQKLLALRAAGSPRAIQNVDLPDADVDALIAFLKTLTDPCLKSKACLSQWVPSARDPDPDGLRLCAKDGRGRELLPGSCPWHKQREASR